MRAAIEDERNFSWLCGRPATTMAFCVSSAHMHLNSALRQSVSPVDKMEIEGNIFFSAFSQTIFFSLAPWAVTFAYFQEQSLLCCCFFWFLQTNTHTHAHGCHFLLPQQNCAYHSLQKMSFKTRIIICKDCNRRLFCTWMKTACWSELIEMRQTSCKKHSSSNGSKWDWLLTLSGILLSPQLLRSPTLFSLLSACLSKPHLCCPERRVTSSSQHFLK